MPKWSSRVRWLTEARVRAQWAQACAQNCRDPEGGLWSGGHVGWVIKLRKVRGGGAGGRGRSWGPALLALELGKHLCPKLACSLLPTCPQVLSATA